MLNYISFATGLLPILAAAINYKNLNYTLKLIAALLLIAFLVDFSAWIYFLGYIPIKNNQPFIHLSIIVNLIFFIIIYGRFFYKTKLKQFTIISGSLVLAIILFFSVIEGIWQYPSWQNTALSIYMVILSLLYFHQIFNAQEFVHIEEQPLFWINSGVLIYFSFNLFLYMLLEKLFDPDEPYIIHRVTNIISNLFYAIGLFCKHKKVILQPY